MFKKFCSKCELEYKTCKSCRHARSVFGLSKIPWEKFIAMSIEEQNRLEKPISRFVEWRRKEHGW